MIVLPMQTALAAKRLASARSSAMRCSGATCASMVPRGGGRERGRIVNNGSARQGAKRRIQVIKAGVGQRQRQAAVTQLPLEDGCRRNVRTEAAPEPEQAPPRVPDAVARTFQDHAVRKCR